MPAPKWNENPLYEEKPSLNTLNNKKQAKEEEEEEEEQRVAAQANQLNEIDHNVNNTEEPMPNLSKTKEDSTAKKVGRVLATPFKWVGWGLFNTGKGLFNLGRASVQGITKWAGNNPKRMAAIGFMAGLGIASALAAPILPIVIAAAIVGVLVSAICKDPKGFFRGIRDFFRGPPILKKEEEDEEMQEMSSPENENSGEIKVGYNPEKANNNKVVRVGYSASKEGEEYKNNAGNGKSASDKNQALESNIKKADSPPPDTHNNNSHPLPPSGD